MQSNPPSTPLNLANAVEILANVLYLINLKAGNADEVRRCVDLATPAIQMLAVLVEKNSLP